MAKFMNFFPRQVMQGDSGGSTILYSDVFDAATISSVQSELRVYAKNATVGSTVTGVIEQTDEPAFLDSSWTTYQTVIATGLVSTTGNLTTAPKRFLRAKVTTVQNGLMTIHFNCRGFC